MRTAILIPCFNEEETIASVVAAFRAQDPQAVVYVYDNNSTDRSAELARHAGAVVVREPRQGKGFVVRSMFRDIDADVYLMVDGDATYDAGDVLALGEDVAAGVADMVIGDRLSGTYFEENSRQMHGAGNRLVRLLINRIFDADIKDVMTGARAFSRHFVKSYPCLARGFEIETEMTIHALDKDFLITHRDVRYHDRPHGSASKLQTVPDGIRVLKTIFALFKDFRPLAFFGLASAFLLLLGGGFFAVPLVEYLETGLVTKFPTLIVSVGLMVMSLLSATCGVILDSIRKQTRTFYELELMRERSSAPRALSESDGSLGER